MTDKRARELEEYFALNPDKIRIILEKAKSSSLLQLEKNEYAILNLDSSSPRQSQLTTS